jgi:hypothetical protein
MLRLTRLACGLLLLRQTRRCCLLPPLRSCLLLMRCLLLSWHTHCWRTTASGSNQVGVVQAGMGMCRHALLEFAYRMADGTCNAAAGSSLYSATMTRCMFTRVHQCMCECRCMYSDCRLLHSLLAVLQCLRVPFVLCWRCACCTMRLRRGVLLWLRHAP